jgi:uncharacterized protein (TIGR00251 family)
MNADKTGVFVPIGAQRRSSAVALFRYPCSSVFICGKSVLLQEKRAMRITLKVHPRARRNLLAQTGGEYKLEVTAPPVDGAANDAVIEFFARALKLPRAQVRIVTGEKSRRKVVEIIGVDHLPDL